MTTDGATELGLTEGSAVKVLVKATEVPSRPVRSPVSRSVTRSRALSSMSLPVRPTGIVGVGCCIGSAGAAARRQSPAHQSPARGPWRPAVSGSLPARGDKRSQEQCLRPCASSGTR
ncbi:hypothetical protein [Streptomyces sp. NBC_00513]|uniref:hypothetical protein n=1 Tax=Streptomyces sp. NBC_00513 TaxID=2975763 RepID=UPI00352CA968